VKNLALQESEPRLVAEIHAERTLLRQQRIVVLADFIDSATAQTTIEDIHLMIAQNQAPIKITLSSNGGAAEAGLAIIDAIRYVQSKGVFVVGVVLGHAMSMAFLILQACDKRDMYKGGWLMAHGLTSIAWGDIKDTEAELVLLHGLRDQFARLIAERNTSENSIFKSPEHWVEILERKTPKFLSAKEALEIGVVDEVL